MPQSVSSIRAYLGKLQRLLRAELEASTDGRENKTELLHLLDSASASLIFAPRAKPKRRKSNKPRTTRPLPNHELELLWQQLQAEYFPERKDILDYRIRWSNRRHTRTLASCNVRARRVSVAAAMRLDESRRYLPALVYHEMCHAILGEPERKGSRRVIHGSEFKKLERRHPEIPLLDKWITQGGWFQASRRQELQNYARELESTPKSK